MGAIDYGAHKSAGFGCYSQAILELDGDLSEPAMRSALDQISSEFPLIHGRVARDWMNLAPYWKVPVAAKPIPLRVVELSTDALAESERLLDDHANTPFDSESEHLRFLLLKIGRRKSRLGMVFDHRLLDAFGAESMFRLINECFHGRLSEIAPRVRQTEPAHLDHWQRRFSSGKTLNRFLQQMNQRSVCALSEPPRGSGRRIRFLHDSLTPEETAAFTTRAAEEIGMPIILPSATARAIVALRRAVPTLPLPGEQYLAFTTVNQRFPGQEWEKLFFNHLSLMTLSSGTDQALTAPEIAIQLRDQFFEQTKLQIPFVMEDAGALGRICPHWIGSRLMRLVAGGRLCSFYFVCLRENGFTESSFLGQPVSNLIHKPLTFFPPGLNVCMTWFGNRFNLIVSYLEGAIADKAAEELLGQFKAGLVK